MLLYGTVWNLTKSEEEASHLIIPLGTVSVSVGVCPGQAPVTLRGVRVHSPPSATRTSLRYGYVYEDLNFYVRD